MIKSKASKEPKAPKGSKGPKGPHNLRIPSPLSQELDELVYEIIGVGMQVHSAYGPGLKENLYEDAYVIALDKWGIPYERQVPIDMFYQGAKVRRFRLDLVVAKQIIVELKAVAQLHPVHSSQMLTYLKLTQLPVGIILNFNERHLRDGIRRHVLEPIRAEQGRTDNK